MGGAAVLLLRSCYFRPQSLGESNPNGEAKTRI